MKNRIVQVKGYVFVALMLVGILCLLSPAPAMQAATYAPLSCVAGQHINFTVNPVDSGGKAVVLDLSSAHAAWSFSTPGVISVTNLVLNCVAAGTSTATLAVTNSGVSNTTLSESFQVTVNPPPPAVTFGFVFQPASF